MSVCVQLTFNNNEDEQPGWSDQACCNDVLVSEIVEFNNRSTPTYGPFGIVNLTGSYLKQGGPQPPSSPARLVQRGFAFTEDYLSLYIVDEIDFAAAANFTWYSSRADANLLLA